MQFARDSGPFLLLRGDQLPVQLANLVVADAQRAFLGANVGLRRASPAPLDHEPDDQQRLKGDKPESGRHVPPIALP
ncbi:hypothetical protein D3C87_2037790 [compost metagenome]